MLPHDVRRVGLLRPRGTNGAELIGTIATFLHPDGVSVSIECRLGLDAHGGRPDDEPDYLGRWGKAPFMYGWRLQHPDINPNHAFLLFVDAPGLVVPHKFVCVEKTEAPDHYDVYWSRRFFRTLPEVLPLVAQCFFLED